ncbi:mediator complex, subunit Med7 [Hysterangium stoloniferum]|nr:mediator complex, subunit Med7 [Hysterangium stoloniferum]
MEEDQELQNPFPSPPSHYNNYTSQNLALISLLKSRLEESEQKLEDFDDAALVAKQHELLPNENLPEWPLAQLNKPRVDWILEEGVYNAFGDTWFTNERMPSLEEQGGTQLYPSDPTVDRRPALKSVLSTLLFTYSSFLSSIIAPPPPLGSDVPPDWHRLLEWMRIMGQNIMGAANDLRPVQARANLEAMMTRQLELRRDETKSIHAKCDALEAKLAELRLHSMSAANSVSLVLL